MLHANGAYVWLETINRAVHDPSTGKQEFQCASRDIAERMEAQAREREHEQQLYQVSRLASLGTLVAGIGHEINNPNNFIRLNSQNLAGFWKDIRTALDTVVRTGPGLKFRGIPYETARGMVDDLLKGIVEGSRRIERLLVNLRDFASGDEGALDQAVDLNAVVKSALVIIESSVRKSTNRFLFREAAELPHIRGNYYQLEQVVINLVTNACQALTSLEKTVRVETQRESDGRVVLRVEDEGVGIPAEDIQHLLDPFFTTRRERGGSGLGLAMTSRIIQNHGGTIGFASEVGRGTVVTVRLPPVRSVA
jgi:signal transduction histidine kinase